MEFNHLPVMLQECLEGLNIKKDGIYVDGTLGGAGHSTEILKRIPKGRLIAIDKDEDAIKTSYERLNKISDNFVIVHDDFKNFVAILDKLDIKEVDGFLLDLGVSSYQLDNYERGFSYIGDGKLDMRMDKNQKLSAYEVVNTYSEEKLAKIIYEYGDERFSRKIAKNIIIARQNKPIETTQQLVEIIERCYPSKIKNKGGAVSKKTFQAIRIEVNGELNRLKECIEEMIAKLKKGGRICVITFHSLEDKIVKSVFKEKSTNCICPPEIPICVCKHKAEIKMINHKVITATVEEIANNKRSHSAKLRVAEKI